MVDATSPRTKSVEVVTTHLEMLAPDDLRPAPCTGLVFRKAEVACPELNRFFYTAVGGSWFWIDRLSWTYERWLAYLDRDQLHTWVGYVKETPAGYCEIEQQADGYAEIRSFGLLPQFIGRGYGGDLLTRSVQQAWVLGASRVWLHTCNLDSPRGLKNYLARGFRVFRTVQATELIPIEMPGPWPGSGRAG